MKYEDISNLYEAGEITMDKAVNLRIAYWKGMIHAMGNIKRLERKAEMLRSNKK